MTEVRWSCSNQLSLVAHPIVAAPHWFTRSSRSSNCKRSQSQVIAPLPYCVLRSMIHCCSHAAFSGLRTYALSRSWPVSLTVGILALSPLGANMVRMQHKSSQFAADDNVGGSPTLGSVSARTGRFPGSEVRMREDIRRDYTASCHVRGPFVSLMVITLTTPSDVWYILKHRVLVQAN